MEQAPSFELLASSRWGAVIEWRCRMKPNYPGLAKNKLEAES
jgi:hypothetical protein